MTPPHPIIPARLTGDPQHPVAADYGDVYFANDDGVAESRYVFLDGNNLSKRCAETEAGFTLTETGFGTGLNCLLSLREFLEQAPSDAILRYISIDKHPLQPEALAQFYQVHPLHEEAQALLHAYPLPVPGVHRLSLAEGRVELWLLWMDIAEALAQLRPASVQAWYLDGFAPAKNPAMWADARLQQIADATAPGGTFATFTAAGAVRRGLESAGFYVEKQPGYGGKRQRLVGHMPSMERPDTATSPARASDDSADVIIIGGGIAGMSAAYSCARRGFSTLVLEQADRLAAGASGNPAGILYPFVASQWDAATMFYLRGFSHTRQLLRSISGVDYELCGMRHYPKTPGSTEQRQRLQRLAEQLQLDASVIQPTDYGFRMPGSGWVGVPSLCQGLQHAGLELATYQRVTGLHYRDGCWQVTTSTGESHTARHLILANAYEAETLMPRQHWPLRRIRGQITYLPQEHLTEPVEEVLCYGGYLTPAINGLHYLGATFDKGRDDLSLEATGHAENLATLQRHFPGLLCREPDPAQLEGRAAFRTVSGDRMPIVGAVADGDALEQILANTRYSRAASACLRIPRLPGCYATLAHSARGLVSVPLAGEAIAGMIADEPVAMLTEGERHLLDPARFRLRDWRRGKP